MAVINAGGPAPDFAMTNQDGATVSLGQFAGKYVLLWWYPKADTRG
jgi:peroxiredoxin Q/BCP